MQTQLDTFNKLEELSNTLFCGFKQIGGRDNTQFNSEITSADSLGGKLLESANTIFKSSVKAIDPFIPHSIMGTDVGDKPWDDIAPNLINNIEESGILVSQAVKDPKVRKALEKAIAVYGQALNEVYGIAEPEIDELITKFWITIDNMGEKSARGATNAMISTVSAVIAEIPVVGGLVDLFIAGGKWFNAIASGIIAPSIIAHGDVTGKAIYTGREGLAIKNKYGPELSSVTSDLRTALSEAMPPAGERPLNPLGPREPVPMTQLNSTNNSTIMRSQDRGGANRVHRRKSMQSRKAGARADSAKLGYKGAKAIRTVKKAKSKFNKSRRGGHQPFMFGGSKKSSKRVRKHRND